ncbi:hypothetical protein ACF068_00225 [Streptomyces sp. NPDC016309]|uniref:hypothetical protein n=1 Tax=Streptomyces sp. NPDC016309 TaxID=3364965 RepID=UPI0036FAE5AE
MNPTRTNPGTTGSAPAEPDDTRAPTAKAPAAATATTDGPREHAPDDDATRTHGPAGSGSGEDAPDAPDDDDATRAAPDDDATGDASRPASGPGGVTGGLAAAAAAVVATALGLASLTGTWPGRVAAERETLVGQIATSRTGSATQQISEIYGDAWHTTAFVNGLFALLALLTGLVVLTRPRRPQWVGAVALAGAVLGGLGLLLSAGMYADLFLPLPGTGA